MLFEKEMWVFLLNLAVARKFIPMCTSISKNQCLFKKQVDHSPCNDNHVSLHSLQNNVRVQNEFQSHGASVLLTYERFTSWICSNGCWIPHILFLTNM